MSTIFACFNPTDPVSAESMEKMLSASAYWQPDATSSAVSLDYHCRMARAALFNTAGSKLEAVHRDDAGNLISANARLDNRGELARALAIPDGELSDMADGALILAAWRKWGEDSPKHLLGDFAFVIWDAASKSLFCARDHFGVKALFYGHGRQGWMVTNEHNAFFTAGAMDKEIEEAWLIHHLWNLGGKERISPYAGVELLPPAHSMRIDSHGITRTRYWNLEEKNDWAKMDHEALLDELKRRFDCAVRSRLDSEYPLAAELSEGIDSNGIAGFAANAMGDKTLYTLSYSCAALDDENRHIWQDTYRDIEEMIAMHDNLEPIWTSAKYGPENREDMQSFFRHAGGVMAINGGHFLRSRLASEKGARVLLSGWGGDHCVSTYGDFYESELLRSGRLVEIAKLFRAKHARKRSGKPFKASLQLLIKHLTPPLYRFLIRRRGGLEKALWQRAAKHPLKPQHIHRHRLHQKLKQFTDHYQRYSVKAHHRRELFDIGVEGRLIESELCGRMYRIEYRYPMLDVPLVELAYNMPSHLKIHNGIERYMFRQILEGVTTERIQWRVKADVNHPNIDHDTSAGKQCRELSEQLRQSRLASRFFDRAQLERLPPDMGGMMSIRKWSLLLDIERQIDAEDASITDAG